MTGAEQIQCAAKALGYIDDRETCDAHVDQNGLHKSQDGCFYIVWEHGWRPWEPRKTPEDAFDLAIRAGIIVRKIEPYVYAISEKRQHQVRIDGDVMAAACEAVVLAAAEIGEAME